MVDSLIGFVREWYGSNNEIPLHAPHFRGREKALVRDAIDSSFVSSVGQYVDTFERDVERYTGSESAVATVNGTAALHIALQLVGVAPDDLVITQPITFVATSNAIAYCGATPVFVDVDRETLGLSPGALEEWLEGHAFLDDQGTCRSLCSRSRIAACLPVHTFGHPVDLEALQAVCARWGIALVEDAAESLGSFFKGQHTGTFGSVGAISFNGNKIITTGGGGMILAEANLGRRAKHLTTTAKVNRPYEFFHDEVGYNYRMPNLNAALGCAQLERLTYFLKAKRDLANAYKDFFKGSDFEFVVEPENCHSNYWLNALICPSEDARREAIRLTNKSGVMTRPIWTMVNKLPPYKNSPAGRLNNAEWLEKRVLNLPSSVHDRLNT